MAAAEQKEVRSTRTLASPHRFSSEAADLEAQFKALLKETEADGWKSLGEKKGVAVSNKPTSTPLGLLKGVGIIEGFSTREVYAVAQLPGCRQVWDDLFESGRGVEVLDKTCVLSYASTKAQGLVSSRDMAVLVLNEFLHDGRIYSMSKSVIDPALPPVKGKVRAVLKVMGWYMEPVPGRLATKVVYITEIDLGGWIPGNVLKLAAGEIPMVIAGVRKYLNNHHAIAFPEMLGGAPVSTPQFDHSTSGLTMDIEIINSISPFTEFTFSKKRYPHGINFKIEPADGLEFEINNKGNLIIKHGKDELNGKRLHLEVEKRNSGGRVIMVNGNKISGDETAPASAEEDQSAQKQSFEAGSTATTSANVSGSNGNVSDLIEEAKRRLDELERLLSSPHQTNRSADQGTAILLVIPIVAYVCSRIFG